MEDSGRESQVKSLMLCKSLGWLSVSFDNCINRQGRLHSRVCWLSFPDLLTRVAATRLESDPSRSSRTRVANLKDLQISTRTRDSGGSDSDLTRAVDLKRLTCLVV